MRAKILWIERKRAEGPSFVSSLQKKGFGVEVVTTGNAALDRIQEYVPDLVVVNAASLHSNGKRICRSLRDQVNGVPILVINGPDQPLHDDPCANSILSLPFTVRKLVNRINPLLPGGGDDVIQCGPIRLDKGRRLVSCEGREPRPLTPHLTHLLLLFLLHPGDVLYRDWLFSEVWKTAYTGDTRTLDVHISWLRQALEPDPHKPKFLKTVRGVGYRLDV
jgi:DNA-binding response OmpR family regulator